MVLIPLHIAVNGVAERGYQQIIRFRYRRVAERGYRDNALLARRADGHSVELYLARARKSAVDRLCARGVDISVVLCPAAVELTVRRAYLSVREVGERLVGGCAVLKADAYPLVFRSAAVSLRGAGSRMNGNAIGAGRYIGAAGDERAVQEQPELRGVVPYRENALEVAYSGAGRKGLGHGMSHSETKKGLS